MAGLKVAIAVLAVISISLGVGAQVNHIVGGDRGWDPANSDLASWSSDKRFRVGDQIWFAYSAAHGYIAEVKSKEEFESCDVSNPIRMFTEGLDSTTMEKEGLRYFTSSNVDSCKKGLKLNVNVLPQKKDHSETVMMPKVVTSENSGLALAEGPTTPSGSAHLTSSILFLSFGLLCYVMGI